MTVEEKMLKTIVGYAHGALVFGRRTDVLAAEIGGLLPGSAHVLDVGTGDGRIASGFARNKPGVVVEGIDILVRERTHIPVKQFNGRQLPYADKSIDVVTFVDVLHHTEYAQELLAEAARVARTAVILKDHLAESSFDHWTLRLMDWVGNAPHGITLPYTYVSREHWDARFSNAGLAVELFTTDVALYPPPMSFLFGRKLHFIARLRPEA